MTSGGVGGILINNRIILFFPIAFLCLDDILKRNLYLAKMTKLHNTNLGEFFLCIFYCALSKEKEEPRRILFIPPPSPSPSSFAICSF